MNRFELVVLIGVLLTATTWGLARQSPDAEQPPAATQSTASTKPHDCAALERQFARTLSGAVFEGTWQEKTPDGLSAPRTDRYTIIKALRAEDDLWSIQVRIQYADRDVTLPLKLRVAWLEDTPMFVIDDVFFPGIGVYSARVMIYRDLYSGTWFGKDCGGVLSGVIRRDAASKTK